MKNIIYLLMVVVLVTTTSCYDDFKEDFDTTAMYFPHQQPLRTVFTSDPEIEVGIVLGGKRKNDVNELASFGLAPELVPSGEMMLPKTHYTMDVDSDSVITIESGMFQGEFNLTLTDAFFADPLSLGNNYVLPLKLTGFTTDRVVLGKDYVLLKLKYINDFHGTYYQLGSVADTVYKYDASVGRTELIDDLRIYDAVDVTTLSTNQVSVPVIGDGSEVTNSLLLTVAEDNSLSAELGTADANVQIQGFSGRAASNEYIVYNYSYQVGSDDPVAVYDSLVFRDNGVVFETW